MVTPDQKSRLEKIIDVLDEFGVEFIVVGGQAEYLFGSPRHTFDVDICYRKTPQNLERLAAALKKIKPTLRNAPPDLPFIIDAKSLALGDNFTFDTQYGDLDFLGYLEPLGGYEEIIKRAETIPIDGRPVKIIGLDDLIRIMEHIRRPKDRESLEQLLKIKRVRAELE
jgi:predicted nucleotidyltransferase